MTERTIEELMLESQLRADRGAYPMDGINPVDAKEALPLISTRDRDEWAKGWSTVAQKYLNEAAKAPDAQSAGVAYKKAWRLY